MPTTTDDLLAGRWVEISPGVQVYSCEACQKEPPVK